MYYNKIESYKIKTESKNYTLDIYKKNDAFMIYVDMAFWGTFENLFEALTEISYIVDLITNKNFDLGKEIERRFMQ